jgi:hypothetical protein
VNYRTRQIDLFEAERTCALGREFMVAQIGGTMLLIEDQIFGLLCEPVEELVVKETIARGPARIVGRKKAEPLQLDVQPQTEVPLSAYPEALRDRRADSQRAVWDAAQAGFLTVAEIATRTHLTPSSVAAALANLLRKSLAVTDGNVPACWRSVKPAMEV